jgi:Gram-negative bacterial TonB protein C-terminal
MNRVLVMLVAASVGWPQTGSDSCCKCGSADLSELSTDVICLSAKDMRAHVDHVEPLRPSGLGKDLNIAGTIVVEIRFGSDGKVACARARSGNPIAISAAMEAVPKWTFKPIVLKGATKSGCGRITIKYRLRDQGSSTEIQ